MLIFIGFVACIFLLIAYFVYDEAFLERVSVETKIVAKTSEEPDYQDYHGEVLGVGAIPRTRYTLKVLVLGEHRDVDVPKPLWDDVGEGDTVVAMYAYTRLSNRFNIKVYGKTTCAFKKITPRDGGRYRPRHFIISFKDQQVVYEATWYNYHSFDQKKRLDVVYGYGWLVKSPKIISIAQEVDPILRGHITKSTSGVKYALYEM
jgi:hypothetical protein